MLKASPSSDINKAYSQDTSNSNSTTALRDLPQYLELKVDTEELMKMASPEKDLLQQPETKEASKNSSISHKTPWNTTKSISGLIRKLKRRPTFGIKKSLGKSLPSKTENNDSYKELSDQSDIGEVQSTLNEAIAVELMRLRAVNARLMDEVKENSNLKSELDTLKMIVSDFYNNYYEKLEVEVREKIMHWPGSRVWGIGYEELKNNTGLLMDNLFSFINWIVSEYNNLASESNKLKTATELRRSLFKSQGRKRIGALFGTAAMINRRKRDQRSQSKCVSDYSGRELSIDEPSITPLRASSLGFPKDDSLHVNPLKTSLTTGSLVSEAEWVPNRTLGHKLFSSTPVITTSRIPLPFKEQFYSLAREIININEANDIPLLNNSDQKLKKAIELIRTRSYKKHYSTKFERTLFIKKILSKSEKIRVLLTRMRILIIEHPSILEDDGNTMDNICLLAPDVDFLAEELAHLSAEPRSESQIDRWSE